MKIQVLLFIENNLCVSGSTQFRPMLFKGQLQSFINKETSKIHALKKSEQTYKIKCCIFTGKKKNTALTDFSFPDPGEYIYFFLMMF